MIRSFADKDTAKVFHRQRSPRLPNEIQHRARRKLLMLEHAQSLADLRVPPGNHLERLKGEQSGQHSIRINQQWRICFIWEAGDAFDVQIIDYH